MGIPSKSKIPLRGIGKLFTHLPSGVRAKLESAFVEAETQINYHNRAVVDDQERRRLSSYVSAPVAVLTQNSRGFDVTWDRLEDRLISFYEAHVALNSNFADPTTYNLTETSFAVEGVGTTVYVRVRGVRWDGDTGNWSNTVTMDGSVTSGPVTYSRGLDDVEPFYVADPGNVPWPKPIQHLTITPLRQNGGMMIFGSIAAGPNINPTTPVVGITLNGVTVSEVTSTDLNIAGGASYALNRGVGFGPVFVSHDSFYFGDQEDHLATARYTSGTASSSGTHTPWTSANPTVYNVTWAAHNVEDAQTSDTNFDAYGFAVPAANEIVGIQVDYTATDSNYGTGVYAESDLVHIKLLDAGTARASKVSGLPEWGNAAKTFGGRSDLWGEVAGYWTPTKINDADFGVQLRGRVYVPADLVAPYEESTSSRTIRATWPVITVYSANETTGEVNIQIRFRASGDVLNACTLNVIEFGDDL